MAKVVFATIGSLDDLDRANWADGDNTSYANTMKMVGRWAGIRLIGRMAKDGSVQLQYASNANGKWVVVGAGALKLARYFNEKLKDCPSGDRLDVFFSEIDNESAKNAVQQLLGAECGINVTKEPHGKLHLAVMQIQSKLRALGVPAGDWTFVPMLNSFAVQA